MISIRPASRDDAETLSEVLCASIRELCSADHKNDRELIAQWTSNKTPGHIAQWASDPRSTLCFAERDGQPAGVGCVSDDGEVLLNYVAPDHRFRGVSRAVLAYMEKALIRAGVRTARLTSTETAHRFYREAGWRDAGEPEIVFGLTGYPMEKELRSESDTTA